MGDPFWIIYGWPFLYCAIKFVDNIPSMWRDVQYLWAKHVRKEPV